MWIHERFFLRAQQQPHHVAVILGQEQLTYGELAGQAERIAHKLMQLLGQQARVAIQQAKSPRSLIMMLACLQAGMTYVPIDVKCPVERRNQILEDCQAELLVIDDATIRGCNAQPTRCSSLRAVIGPRKHLPCAARYISWDELNEPDEAGGQTPALPPISPESLAYILYTSGSTGIPKGVMITHRNAGAFVDWGCDSFDISANDHIAAHAPVHFDLSVFDVFVGLAKGAALHLVDERTALFPEALYRFLRDHEITVLYAVPSALTALIQGSSLRNNELPKLRYLLYAGEEFHPTPLGTLMGKLPHARIFNLYGPIETNVVTQCEVKQENLSLPRIPIGYPIFNTKLFLLGDNMQPIQEGEGEIVISGPSVSPGYLNRPQQTQASRCILNEDGHTWVCYRTGDFAHRDASGLLYFLGRRDDLVKTRGFRVELGEVEAALLRLPAVAEAAVVALPHSTYSHLLYAFVVLQKGQQVRELELLAGLREYLPSYMCPFRVFFQAELPKTSSGKIARQALQNELRSVVQNR